MVLVRQVVLANQAQDSAPYKNVLPIFRSEVLISRLSYKQGQLRLLELLSPITTYRQPRQTDWLELHETWRIR